MSRAVSPLGFVGVMAMSLWAWSAAAQAQPAVGRCPTVVVAPAHPYYYPSPTPQLSIPVVAQPPAVVVGGYRPTVVIVLPQSQPAPCPFGPRYDESGRLVAISTPQFIGALPSSLLNSTYRFDDSGRLIGISTPQTLEPGGLGRGLPMILGRPFGAASFFETSGFGGTFRGGLKLRILGE